MSARARQVYVEVDPETDKIVHVHWTRQSVVAKYSSGTYSRIARVMSRADKNSGCIVKGNMWARMTYREGMSFYEVEKRAIDQTRDLKLRWLFNRLSNRNIQDDVTRAHCNELIGKIYDYFEKV
jgi:hypothetical protein